MHQPQIDSVDFAAHLIKTFETHLKADASDTLAEDLEAIKIFAEMPELKAARTAAVRLRLNAQSLHPFAERMLVTAIEELGL